MDPYSGTLYTPEQVEKLDQQTRGRLVAIEGDPRHVRRLKEAAEVYAGITSTERSKRRAANKRARNSRRRNRG